MRNRLGDLFCNREGTRVAALDTVPHACPRTLQDDQAYLFRIDVDAKRWSRPTI